VVKKKKLQTTTTALTQRNKNNSYVLCSSKNKKLPQGLTKALTKTQDAFSVMLKSDKKKGCTHNTHGTYSRKKIIKKSPSNLNP
jgi:hypothetical protein